MYESAEPWDHQASEVLAGSPVKDGRSLSGYGSSINRAFTSGVGQCFQSGGSVTFSWTRIRNYLFRVRIRQKQLIQIRYTLDLRVS